jgi:hypothetical protein
MRAQKEYTLPRLHVHPASMFCAGPDAEMQKPPKLIKLETHF